MVKGFKEIENITKEDGFYELSLEEKGDFLIETLRCFLINEAKSMCISFDENVSLESIIRGINSIKYEYDDRKELNTKILISLINVMSNIQDKKIIYKSMNRVAFKSPVFIYEDGNLVCIKNYCKLDNLEVLVKLIVYLETKFVLDNIKEKSLSLKK